MGGDIFVCEICHHFEMESSKVIGWIIAVVVVVVILGLIVWWCNKSSKNDLHQTVDHRNLKSMGVIRDSLKKNAALTGMYVIEKFAENQTRDARLEAIKTNHLTAYREYFGGYNTDRSQSVTDLFMSKYDLYDAAIENEADIYVSRSEATRINEDIAFFLINCGKTDEETKTCSLDKSCGRTSKIIEVLDTVDKSVFDQITFIHQGNHKASIDCYYESDAATTDYFKWLVETYHRSRRGTTA